MTIFVQSCSTLGGGAHPRFQAIEPAFCPKTIFPWSHGQCDLDTECCYLPTEVVPIYLIAFACFRTARLVRSWDKRWELTTSRGFDLTTAGLLTLQQRLLQFSPQCHRVSHYYLIVTPFGVKQKNCHSQKSLLQKVTSDLPELLDFNIPPSVPSLVEPHRSNPDCLLTAPLLAP